MGATRNPNQTASAASAEPQGPLNPAGSIRPPQAQPLPRTAQPGYVLPSWLANRILPVGGMAPQAPRQSPSGAWYGPLMQQQQAMQQASMGALNKQQALANVLQRPVSRDVHDPNNYGQDGNWRGVGRDPSNRG